MNNNEFYCVKCRMVVSCNSQLYYENINNNKREYGVPALRCNCPYCNTSLTKFIKENKNNIPLTIKKKVWQLYAHPADNRFAQCATCETIVKYPESLKKYYKNKNILPSIYCGVGEFGHIIPEAIGGKETVDNLMIQCKDCNTKLGTKILEIPEDMDIVMMDVPENQPKIVYMDSDRCLYNRAGEKKDRRCKNKSIDDSGFCSIHIGKY